MNLKTRAERHAARSTPCAVTKSPALRVWLQLGLLTAPLGAVLAPPETERRNVSTRGSIAATVRQSLERMERLGTQRRRSNIMRRTPVSAKRWRRPRAAPACLLTSPALRQGAARRLARSTCLRFPQGLCRARNRVGARGNLFLESAQRRRGAVGYPRRRVHAAIPSARGIVFQSGPQIPLSGKLAIGCQLVDHAR